MQKDYKNPPRYRLDFIKENTFNRIWSVRMSRTRLWIVCAAVVAAIAALIWVIMAFTPMRRLLPMSLTGELRTSYLATAQKVDSLEAIIRLHEVYTANIEAIMNDDIDADSLRQEAELTLRADSLLQASAAEQAFLQNYEDEVRFKLSVLAPIAAEGMVFSTPADATATITPLSSGKPGIIITAPSATPVSAVYRGSVTGVYTDVDGLTTVVIQHPNDFLSIYSGLRDAFVEPGSKVVAGQRIGHAPGEATFELWHNGVALPPDQYINLQ